MNFYRADLSGADFTDVRLGYTVFADTDLSAVVGLDSAKHEGPSTIGLDTFFRSKGKIPGAFLRKAGVPDIFIEYAVTGHFKTSQPGSNQNQPL